MGDWRGACGDSGGERETRANCGAECGLSVAPPWLGRRKGNGGSGGGSALTWW
jgi:hypothetical protein